MIVGFRLTILIFQLKPKIIVIHSNLTTTWLSWVKLSCIMELLLVILYMKEPTKIDVRKELRSLQFTWCLSCIYREIYFILLLSLQMNISLFVLFSVVTVLLIHNSDAWRRRCPFRMCVCLSIILCILVLHYLSVDHHVTRVSTMPGTFAI
jgi:hypothetical protein